jgi:hypothetical protein
MSGVDTAYAKKHLARVRRWAQDRAAENKLRIGTHGHFDRPCRRFIPVGGKGVGINPKSDRWRSMAQPAADGHDIERGGDQRRGV